MQAEAGLGVATGLAPSSSFAPLVRLQLVLQKLYSVGLEGRLGITQTQRVVSEPRGALEYRSAAVALLGCVAPLGAARLELAVCADARVGSLGVQGRDFAYSYGVRAHWLELALSGRLRVALLGPTSANLGVGVPWRVVRPRFKYESSQGGLRDAFWLARWGLDLSLSLGVEF
jgi:hypothetical protein